jgi:multiple sugar transport system permease protein
MPNPPIWKNRFMRSGLPVRKRSLGKRIGEWTGIGIGFILALIFLAPMLWVALSSFKTPQEAVQPPLPPWPTRGVSVDTYKNLDGFGEGLAVHTMNSVVVSISTAVVTIMASALAGYGFSRFDFRGKNLFFLLIMMTMMIPFQSILTPLFFILSRIELQNSLAGLVLVYSTLQLPFSVFMMRNSFDAVPAEIEEAARIDGCSTFGLFVLVMIRLAIPGVVTVGIFAFLTSWNEFLAALILLTNSEKYTLPILMAAVRTGVMGGIDWGAVQAGVTVMMMPCLILFLAFQRYYVRGLTAGAVK